MILLKLATLSTEVRLAERSKAPDLSSGTRMSARVRTPHLTENILLFSQKENIFNLFLLQAIDVWMGVCTAFVFAALVEFTFVNYLWRKTCATAREYSGRMGLKGGMENGNNTRHFGTSMDRTNNTDAGVELNLVSLHNYQILT